MHLVLADDHPAFRFGLRLMLEGVDDLDVQFVAEVSNGEEAIQAAVEHRPDIVVMDLHMPVLGGVDATREIVVRAPGTHVLILTMADDEDSVTAALRAGARGYVLKNAGRDELARAVRAVAAGESIFSPVIAAHVSRCFTGARPCQDRVVFPELTAREREVLGLVAQGLTNQEITRRLMLRPKTVRNHVSNCMSKLRLSSRSAAIVCAREAGLGGPPITS